MRSIDDKGDLAWLIHTLGYIAQYEEDFELAESQFRKSLTMFRRLGNRGESPNVWLGWPA